MSLVIALSIDVKIFKNFFCLISYCSIYSCKNILAAAASFTTALSGTGFNTLKLVFLKLSKDLTYSGRSFCKIWSTSVSSFLIL